MYKFIVVFCCDDRGKFIEKLTLNNQKKSRDGSMTLISEVSDSGLQRGKYCVCVKIDLSRVNPDTIALLVYLDGGPRNFMHLNSCGLRCRDAPGDRGEGTFLSGAGSTTMSPLFRIASTRTRRDYQGIALCTVYKDGWKDIDSAARKGKNVTDSKEIVVTGESTKPLAQPMWACTALFEPVYLASDKRKEAFTANLVINVVPSLEKCRRRLFSNVRDVCAALSSQALPHLKKKFNTVSGALSIGEFTAVLFKQLYETQPLIVLEIEAGYAVAMLQEMFCQIDYNGDGSVNWDEFTTFLTLTGLSSQGKAKGLGGVDPTGGSDILNEYTIEYAEDISRRDQILQSTRTVSLMRYVPENKKILLISENSDNILVMDSEFKLLSKIEATRVQPMSNNKDTVNGI
jgi:hypothetical protein